MAKGFFKIPIFQKFSVNRILGQKTSIPPATFFMHAVHAVVCRHFLNFERLCGKIDLAKFLKTIFQKNISWQRWDLNSGPCIRRPALYQLSYLGSDTIAGYFCVLLSFQSCIVFWKQCKWTWGFWEGQSKTVKFPLATLTFIPPVTQAKLAAPSQAGFPKPS